MYTIAVSNQKGGVGKTSLCLHMAGAMAQRKHKVLLIDMDQQGNLTKVTRRIYYPSILPAGSSC